MEEEKNTKKKFKIIEMYSILILIATIFMSIVYAKVSDVEMEITGDLNADSQEGIFITKVTTDSMTDDENLEYVSTTLISTIALQNNINDTKTIQVTIYNKNNEEYMFIDAITDKNNTEYYSNTNIEFELSGITPYETTIAPQSTMTFNVTFKYKDGADVMQNILTSYLNFRFRPIPILKLSNDGINYNLNNIYPGYTPTNDNGIYEFKVTNFNNGKINKVPLSYTFETTIDAPLEAKIYNEEGQEVLGSIIIGGDGETLEEHTYTLKILFDGSYNDYNEYSNKTYNCNVNVIAVPDDTDYLDYKISKEFDVDISTIPFYFSAEVDDTLKDLISNEANLTLSVANYDGDDYNAVTTQYEISIENNNKFDFTVDNETPTDGKITKVIDGNSAITNDLNIKFIANTSVNPVEKLILKIKTNSPYLKEIEIAIDISSIIDPDYWIKTKTTDPEWYTYAGANVNRPELTGYMTPIKYIGNETNWDTNTFNNRWANAETADGSMWVWIPRYAYKINYDSDTSRASGTIDVAFVDINNQFLNSTDTGTITTNPEEEGAGTTKWLVHPAFVNDVNHGGWDSELKGIWIGKFETTGDTTTVTCKPGTPSIRSMITNAQYRLAQTATYGETATLNPHMTKNSEWGAIVYLAVSKYGTKGYDVAKNSSSSFYTGGTNIIQNIYTTNCKQSTTYNAYGIYDLRGGAYERAASYVDYKNSYITTNGGTKSGDLYGTEEERSVSTRYKTVYPAADDNDYIASYELAKSMKGDAIYETSTFYTDKTSWNPGTGNSVYSYFTKPDYPIFGRGGPYSESVTGMFYFYDLRGGVTSTGGFRTVLAW